MHARTSQGTNVETEAVRRVREARIAASLLKSPVRYQCSICTETFAQKKGLYRHLRETHDAEAEITAAKSNFRREATAKSNFRREATAKSNFRREVTTKRRKKRETKVVFYSLRCHICSQSFAQRSSLVVIEWLDFHIVSIHVLNTESFYLGSFLFRTIGQKPRQSSQTIGQPHGSSPQITWLPTLRTNFMNKKMIILKKLKFLFFLHQHFVFFFFFFLYFFFVFFFFFFIFCFC